MRARTEDGGIAVRAAEYLAAVPPGGYRQFVALGIRRLA
jgi:hypothetical protein